LAALGSQVQNIVFLTKHINTSVPIAQPAWQAVVLGRLSLSMFLWLPTKSHFTFVLLKYFTG
jgi:hypothetical protein